MKYEAEVFEILNEAPTLTDMEVAQLLKETHTDVSIDSLRRSVNNIRKVYNAADREVIETTVKLAKQKQKFQDQSRIKDKSFREYARIENALEEYNLELIKAIQKFPFKRKAHKPNVLSSGAGIFHLTDLHLNELIYLMFNKYDFTEASKRLKLFVDEAKSYFKTKHVKNILVAATGDLLNSDRRLDEYLNQATNRANASTLGAHLIKQVLEDLAQDFNLSVAFVSGNESRTKQEIGWSNIVATDNYDFTIFNILRYLFDKDKRINFILGDASELVVKVAGQNILMIHGNDYQVGAGNKVETKIMQVIGKYATRGIIIRFAIFGHLHSARISDYFARGASLPGANDYSDKALQLASRASQNIHIVRENGNIDSTKIDLQNVEGVKGYDIIDELEAYNTKSASKVSQHHTIFQVVI